MLQFEEIDEATWESLTPPKKQKESKWDPILAQLETGKVLKVPIHEEKEKRSYRIGIGRTARSRGYKVEFRDADDALAMRKTELPAAPERSASAASPAPGRRRGRPPKITSPSPASAHAQDESQGED